MATYSRQDTWRLWKGTPAELVEIALIAGDAIHELSDTETATISVTMPGVDDKFEPHEFEEGVAQYGPRQIRTLGVGGAFTRSDEDPGAVVGGTRSPNRIRRQRDRWDPAARHGRG
jgi:hypothetical protein